MFFLILGKNAYLYFSVKRQSRFCHRQASRIASSILQGYLYAPFKVHLARNSAVLINTVDHAVDQAFSQVMVPFLVLVTEALAVSAILLMLSVIEPLLTLSLGTVVLIASLLLAWVMRKRLSSLGIRASKLRKDRLRALQQSLHSIKEIKVFGAEAFFLSVFRRAREESAAVQARADSLAQTPRQVLEVVIVGGLMLLILAVLAQGRATADVIKILGLFAMAAFRMMPGANRLVSAYNAIKHGSAYLNETAGDYFSEEFRPGALSPHASAMLSAQIELRNIRFSYDGASHPALDDVTLAIQRGETVGLVGKSGAGKSTLVDLMLGLLKPQSGLVTIDGKDITGTPHVWRSLVGYVPQSVSLIDDTLRKNIAFGIEPGEIDDQKIWLALRQANLAEFCCSLPAGLDTELGERGVRLSGGQRQRVGIARALYHDPAVLVFDEATSSLDTESEYEITKSIEALRGNKTLVVIAHRLSTVEKCDRLVLMKEAKILDIGSFSDLLARSEDFRRMVQLGKSSDPREATSALQYL
jgi:ATP-binding cassette subfamily C protein